VRADEKVMIESTLKTTKGNKTVTAQRLGWTPRQLYYRMAKLGIPLAED
jgi:DNA-binding NtrC family response regulator